MLVTKNAKTHRRLLVIAEAFLAGQCIGLYTQGSNFHTDTPGFAVSFAHDGIDLDLFE